MVPSAVTPSTRLLLPDAPSARPSAKGRWCMDSRSLGGGQPQAELGRERGGGNKDAGPCSWIHSVTVESLTCRGETLHITVVQNSFIKLCYGYLPNVHNFSMLLPDVMTINKYIVISCESRNTFPFFFF